jgi:hypothetical protein
MRKMEVYVRVFEDAEDQKLSCPTDKEKWKWKIDGRYLSGGLGD